MHLARNTRKNQNEIVEHYYGINRETFEIESVSKTRGGTLSKSGKDGSYSTHHIIGDRQAKTEIVIVWGLTDIISFPAQFDGGEMTKRQMADLQAKADAKKEAAKQAKEGKG